MAKNEVKYTKGDYKRLSNRIRKNPREISNEDYEMLQALRLTCSPLPLTFSNWLKNIWFSQLLIVTLLLNSRRWHAMCRMEWEQWHIGKRLHAFHLDNRELRKLHVQVGIEATVDAYGYVYTVWYHCCCAPVWEHRRDSVGINIHIGVGFCVARLTCTGQCEGLRLWDE